MKRILILALALGFCQAHAVALDATKGKTEFLAVGRPSALKINGKGAGPTGDLEIKKMGTDFVINGEANVDLSSLDTGIGMRDRHMKEIYLEVEKFKTARILFKDAKIALEKLKSGAETKISALLDLHGQLKPVEVAMTLSKKGDVVASASVFKLKLSEYGIAIPKYAGITVADEVEVRTETQVPGKTIEGI